MCGRFLLTRSASEVARLLAADEVDHTATLVAPRRNITPMSAVLALTAMERRAVSAAEHDRDGSVDRPSAAHLITARVPRQLRALRWGLVPAWASDPKVGARAFNARAETLLERPSFRSAARTRRCVIPADGFYEWASPPRDGTPSGRRSSKTPWRFRAIDGGLLLLGGLYEASLDEHGRTQVTCTIITTQANEAVAPVHDRMPVILETEDLDRWLEPVPLDDQSSRRLLAPSDRGRLLAEAGVDPTAPFGGSVLE